jgi:hypothetical protein
MAGKSKFSALVRRHRVKLGDSLLHFLGSALRTDDLFLVVLFDGEDHLKFRATFVADVLINGHDHLHWVTFRLSAGIACQHRRWWLKESVIAVTYWTDIVSDDGRGRILFGLDARRLGGLFLKTNKKRK